MIWGAVMRWLGSGVSMRLIRSRQTSLARRGGWYWPATMRGKSCCSRTRLFARSSPRLANGSTAACMQTHPSQASFQIRQNIAFLSGNLPQRRACQDRHKTWSKSLADCSTNDSTYITRTDTQRPKGRGSQPSVCCVSREGGNKNTTPNPALQ